METDSPRYREEMALDGVVNWSLVERVAESLGSCSSIVWRCESGHVLTLPKRCHRRKVCPVCAARMADQDVKRYQAVAARMRSAKLLTLTVGRAPLGKLAEWRSRLLEAFAKLRRQDVLSGVRGGLWALEVVPKSDGYHVHLHVLLDGWIENRNERGRPLETAWAKLTAWSSEKSRRSVDIRRADQGGVREVLKYAVKACCADPEDDNKPGAAVYAAEWPSLAEVITALHGVKVFDCFGVTREDLAEASVQAEQEAEEWASINDGFEAPYWNQERQCQCCPICDAKVKETSWEALARGSP